MENTEELAVIYSALILADDDVSITADKINTILKAANVEVEPIWPSLFAKALSGMNIKDLVGNVGSAASAPVAVAAAPAAAAAAAPAAKAESKKEEKEESEESDGDMGMGLFDD